MRQLYVTMTPRESVCGTLLLAVQLLMLPVLSRFYHAALFFGWCLLSFLAAIVIFRKFLKESFDVPHVTPGQILLKAFLGTVTSQLLPLLINDLIFYFIPDFYIFTDTGPQFRNVACAGIQAMAQEHYLLTAAAVIVLLPAVEELLYRGLVFGKLLPRGRIPAVLASAALFTLVRIAGLIGHYSTAYVLVSCMQYLPMCLFLAWIYTRAETILAPMLAHMVINAVSFFQMR